MKMQLSEWMPCTPDDTQPTADELTLRRVRTLALQKAGYAAPSKRQITKRALVALVAALLAISAFATALATIDLGERLSELLKCYGGPTAVKTTLSEYGAAIGCEDTQDGITVRVDAAYANDAELILAVNLRDAHGRLNDSMNFDPALKGESFRPADHGYGLGDYPHYTNAEDGSVTALLTFPTEKNLSGEGVQLNITNMIHTRDSIDDYNTGITIGAALEQTHPIGLPDLHDAKITKTRVVNHGLYVQIQYHYPGLDIHEAKLLYPDGSVSARGRGILSYVFEGAPVSESEFGFPNIDPEKIKDCVLLLSYAEWEPPSRTKWTLPFKVPESADSQYVEVPIARDIAVGAQGRRYHIESARIHPTLVMVDFTSTPESSSYTKYDGIMFGEDWFTSFPAFALADAQGQPISDPGTWWLANEYDPNEDADIQYRAVIHCSDADILPALQLQISDRRTGDVISTIPLK